MTYNESSFDVRWITFQVPLFVHSHLRKCWLSNAQESRNGRLWQLKLVTSFSHLTCWKCLSLQQIIHFVLQYTVQMKPHNVFKTTYSQISAIILYIAYSVAESVFEFISFPSFEQLPCCDKKYKMWGMDVVAQLWKFLRI